MDMFDRKDVKADQFEKGNIVDVDSIAGRYAAKSRKTTVKVFTKSATLWDLFVMELSLNGKTQAPHKHIFSTADSSMNKNTLPFMRVLF